MIKMLKITLLFALISLQVFSIECINLHDIEWSSLNSDPWEASDSIKQIDKRIKHNSEQLQMSGIDDYDYAYYYYFLGKHDAYLECKDIISYERFDRSQRSLKDP